MRRIAVDSLRESQAVPRPLFHESGAVLIPAGERLGRGEISLLVRHGIRKVYDLGGDPVGPDAPLPAEPVLPGGVPDRVTSFRDERRLLLLQRELERAVPRELPAERMVGEPRSELREGPLAELL
jgi:hypothetical protein